MTYLQALVIALVQGVTELFPVSSLGHSVLVPAWIGGSWQTMVTQSSQASSETSFYLAYIVALHCATALALLWFFRADWARIIRGLFASLLRGARERRLSIDGKDERLAWMIVVATIPVGLTGIALEHTFRTIFAKPAAAAVFLFINGLILLGGERLRRVRHPDSVPADALAGRAPEGAAADRAPAAAPAVTALRPASPGAHARRAGGRQRAEIGAAEASDARIARLPMRDSLYIGVLQIAALFAGVSRSGVTISRSCWPRRPSWPPGCSSCPRSPAAPARTSTARSCSASSSPPSPRTYPCGSWSAGSRPGPSRRSPSTASYSAQPASCASHSEPTAPCRDRHRTHTGTARSAQHPRDERGRSRGQARAGNGSRAAIRRNRNWRGAARG